MRISDRKGANRSARWILPTALLAAGGIGCKGQPITKTVPTIQVELAAAGVVTETFPQLLDGGIAFGTDPVLIPVPQTLSVENLGSAPLSISSIAIVPAGSPFSIEGPAPTEVGGSGSAPLTVVFVPPAQQPYSATLQIVSNDETNPTLGIQLTGTGSTEGELAADPTTVAFGQVGQGQVLDAPTTLSSVGTAPVVIYSFSLDGGSNPAFAFQSSTTIPDGGLWLDAGDTLPLSLSFSPTATTPANPTGAVLIQSSDPTHQPYFVIPLTAQTILAPIPVISLPKTAAVGSTVTADGTQSYDPNTPPLTPLTYQWALTQKLGDSTAELSSIDGGQTSLTLDVAGDYKIQLDVTNTDGVIDVAPAYATVTARPTEDLYIEMIWNNDPIDMDLHLLSDGGVLGGEGDCNAYNPGAGFGCTPGSDHLIGPGPEEVGVPIPPDGDYQVDCVLYAAHNATTYTTIVTVRVYVYGVLTTQVCQQMDKVGQVWEAVTIAWPSGTVTPIGTDVACPTTNN